jgi:hypothetical protein
MMASTTAKIQKIGEPTITPINFPKPSMSFSPIDFRIPSMKKMTITTRKNFSIVNIIIMPQAFTGAAI